MKILFNGSMYTEKPTGVGIYIREVFLNLTALQLIDEKSALYVYSTAGLPSLNNVRTIKLPAPLEFIFRRSLSLHRIIWNYFFLPMVAHRYDIVYSFSSHGSPFIKKQIVTVHDLICMQFPDQHKSQYNYFKYLLPSILKVCKKITVVSNYTRSEVVKHYCVPFDRLVVISGAADHLQVTVQDSFQKEERAIIDRLEGQRFFLIVGASYTHKNTERLIAAAKTLDSHTLLVVVGSDNAYYRWLKEKYADNQIIFLQYVSQVLLGYLYRHCIANVYVSLYEGMGFPPYEAAIYNTVTIASNTTAIPEIYGDALYYIDPLSTADIALALQCFNDGKVDKEVFRKHFHALLQKFTWENTSLAIHRLLQQEITGKK